MAGLRFFAVTLALILLTSQALASKDGAIPADKLMKGFIAQQSGDIDAAADFYREAVALDPESVVPRLKLARLLLLVGEVDQGLEVLEKGLELRPGHPKLLSHKSKALLMNGRNGEAATAAAEAARSEPDPKVMHMATRLLYGVGDFEQALEISTSWAESFPKDADSHFLRGVVLNRIERFEEAEESYRKALEVLPSHLEAMEALGNLLTRQGKVEEALGYYRKIVEGNPHSLDSRFSMVEILIESGEIAEARVMLDGAQRWIGVGAQEKVRLSLMNQQVGRADRALEIMESLPKERRDDRAWLVLGLLQLGAGEYEASLTALEEVSDKSPFYNEALTRKAVALSKLERHEEARELLYGWLAENPDDLEITLALASLLQEDEKLREAATLLEEFQTKRGQSDTRVLFTLGVLYDKLRDWENSVGYMKKILEIDPDNAHALNYVGYTYAEHGILLEEAEAMIVRAIELMPDNGFIIDSLGWVYYKQGRFAKSVETLTRAAELSPADAIIWEHLGDALLKNGLLAKAREAYTRALELDPESEKLPGKLDELQ